MRAVSKKRQKVNRRRWQLAYDYIDADCRLHTPVCTGKAEHFHELVGRAQGGSTVDPRNLTPACDRCNGWVEDNPAISRKYGWKVPSWQAARGDGGLVPEFRSGFAIAWDGR